MLYFCQLYNNIYNFLEKSRFVTPFLPQVDGMMVWLSSGENIVWAVSANGALWYRAGIEQACPMGTNWFRVDTANDKWVRNTAAMP